MKKTKLILMSLISLSLIGCSRAGNSSEIPTSNSSTTSSTPLVSSSSSSNSSKADLVSSDDKPLSSKTDDEPSLDSSESSSVDDPFKEGWNAKVTNAMIKYLNGTVLPFLDLGKNNVVDASYEVGSTDFGKLTIYGDAKWVSGDNGTISQYRTTLSSRPEWAISSKSSTKELYADNATAGVHLVLTKDSDNMINIVATYDEPYDKTAATAWESDIQQSMIADFGQVIPYIYLGAKYPSYGNPSYSSFAEATIDGGKWNDQVLVDAKAAFDAIEGFTTAVDGAVLTAVGKSTDGKNEFKITIQSYGYSVQKIRMDIIQYEGWDPSSVTGWDQDVKDYIADNMDGHQIPFVYLGKKNVTSRWGDANHTLTIDGGVWNDAVLTVADAAHDDTWTKKTDQTGKKFTAVKTFEDGCTITVTIKSDYSGNIAYTASIKQGYNAPDGADWAQDTITEFGLHFPGHTDDLKYVYLNTTNETTSWSENDETLTITGGQYNSKMVDALKAAYGSVLDDSGNPVWSFKYVSGGFDNDKLVATGKMKDGCVFTLTLTYNYSDEALLKIKCIHYYDPNAATAYDADTLNVMHERLAGHELPFIYFNKSTLSSTWSYTSQLLTLTGGSYHEDMIKHAKSVFEQDGWTTSFTDSDTNPVLSASKLFTDIYIGVKIKTDSYGRVVIEISPEENFDTTKGSNWTAKTKSDMTAFLGTDSFPYVYLGTACETSSYSSYSDYLEVYGNCWNSQILTNARTAYEAVGYQIFQNGNELIMFKEDTTNNCGYIVNVTKDSYGFPYIRFYKDSSLKNYKTEGSYSTDVSSKYMTFTKNHAIPYIYMGDDEYTTYASSSGSYLDINGKEWNSKYALAAAQTLKDDGWTDIKYLISYKSLGLTAKKIYEDGAMVNISIKKTYSGSELELVYTDPFIIPENMTSWSLATTRKIRKKMGGDYLPFFYVGTDEPEFYDRTYGFQLEGTLWDEKILENSFNALKAAGFNVIYDYTSTSSSVTKTTYGQKEIDGTVITVKVYNSYSNKAQIDVYIK